MSKKEESTPVEQRTVVHLPDGLKGTEVEDGELNRLAACEKLVLGRSGGTTADGLPHGIHSWPPGLRVLHLLGLEDLTELPSFEGRPDLETIDVTGCGALRALPAISHLEKLEWLDCRNCAALAQLPDAPPPGIQFLYLDGCTGLSHEQLEAFLHALGRGSGTPELVELDLSRTALARLPRFNWPGYWDGEDLDPTDHRSRWESRRWLEKIVLEQCESLVEIALPLEELPNLRHLNLAGCSGLRVLPTLPVVAAHAPPWEQKVLQYLRLDESGVQAHAGSSVRPRHRREDSVDHDRRNAAETLLALQHFGDPVRFPECRLMVLGNSMAGKTTMIRRLHFGLEGEQLAGYVEPEGGREAWRPRNGEKPTHPIQCPAWRVGLPGFSEPATVHVWDFGGHHKYHRSHRAFVREGTLFLLLWRHPDAPLEQDAQRAQELLNEEGAPRTLEYWLDYIVGCEGVEKEDLADRVLIVCTHAVEGSAAELGVELRAQLGKYATKRIRADFFVESVTLESGDGAATIEWRRFYDELRDRLLKAIDLNGSMVPHYFAAVAKSVDGRRRECEEHRVAEEAEDGTPSGLTAEAYRELALPSEEHWFRLLQDVRGQALERPHVRAITANLHGSGSIFWLRPPAEPNARRVIVDQGRALEWIYALLLPERSKGFQVGCRRREGRFDRAHLMADTKAEQDPQPLFNFPWQEDMALQLMRQTRLIVADGDGFLAVEDTLLPDLGEVLSKVHDRRHRAGSAALRFGLRRADVSPIGDGLFQDFRAWLVEQLLHRVESRTLHLYRGGLQVAVESATDLRHREGGDRTPWPAPFLLEVLWTPLDERTYGGNVHVVVRAGSEADAEALRNELDGEQGLLREGANPLGRVESVGEAQGTPLLVADAAARGRFPFGISCRGSNDLAPQIYDRLISLDPPLPTFYYKGAEILEQLKDGHTERVLGQLGACDVMVLLVDEAYLEPSVENRYCLMELATAAFRFDPHNWRRLEEGQTVGFLSTCRKQLGLLHENAEHPRQRADERTLIFLEGNDRRAGLSTRIEAALKVLHDYLKEECEGKQAEDHPLLFFKRAMVEVLVRKGGMAAFNTRLVEADAAISNHDELLRRLEDLARGGDLGR